MSQTVKFQIDLETNGAQVLQSLSIDADDLKAAIVGVCSEVKDLGGTIGGLAEKGLIFSAIRDAVDSLLGAVGGLANEYDAFDRSMRAVNTMAGENREGLRYLKEEVESLAGIIPKTKSELADGLYQVISNGVPRDNWISFLNDSARAAVGGIADLGQTVTVTSTIIKNYGLAWNAAGEIQDKIQVTAKNGVTSFEQLAMALPRVTGQASSLDVNINELLASFATLTGVSGNTAEVSTQLAAIFTALIHPTKEASELAKQMGVQFDAAAIQASGGMQNFLTQLTSDVKRYSDASGMLEQEVFGRLFGSSEALRALIPLTGELAEKFGQNIEAMADSEGVIDAAFEEMSEGGRENALVLKNMFTTMLDWAGAVASAIHPYLSFVAIGGQAIYGLALMVSSLKKARVALMAFAAVQQKNSAVTLLVAAHHKIQAFAQNLLAASSYSATAGTWALTAATTALYAALTLGISLAITGLVTLISNLGEESEKTTEKVDVLRDSKEAFKHAAANATAEMELELASLRSLISAHGNDAEVVEQLNQKYGEAFGNHATASQWYDTLVKKSRAYCTQLGYEAKAKSLATQIAEKEFEREDLEAQLASTPQKRMTCAPVNGGLLNPYEVENPAYAKLKDEIAGVDEVLLQLQSEFDKCTDKIAEANGELQRSTKVNVQAIEWQKMSYTDLGKAIDEQKNKVGNLAGVDDVEALRQAKLLQNMEARYKQLSSQYGLSSVSKKSGNPDVVKYNGENLIANAKSYSDIANNLSFYERELEKADASDKAHITTLVRKIAALKEAQEAIKGMINEVNRPSELNTLSDIDKGIEYQQRLREKATSENVAGIDMEIRRLKSLRTALEESSHVVLGLDQIKTYEQLDAEIGFYENKLRHSTEVERIEVQNQINNLRTLRDEWDESMARLNIPEDISQLTTIDKLNRAIEYYEDRIKHASAEEIAGFQRSKSVLEEKRNALTRVADIASMEYEVSDLGGMNRRQLKIELDLIGLEGVKTKIKSLQRMLDDTKNPLNEDQRKQVARLIGEWKNYENQMKRSDLRIHDVWGSARGLGGSLMGMTQAVKGNSSAWEKMVGIVDGLLGVYDSVKGIVAIVKLFTKTTIAATAAKRAEAIAATTGAAAQGAGAIVAETAAAAQIPVIMGNKAATASYLELAAAAYFAAHAFIPFAGFAIASGFVTAAVATTKTIGATPFAKGGVVYGPTLGLVGEYAGASNNPEVIAPLDKLKTLIQPNDGYGSGGVVEFKIDGRVLRGVLEKVEKVRKRTK